MNIIKTSRINSNTKLSSKEIIDNFSKCDQYKDLMLDVESVGLDEF